LAVQDAIEDGLYQARGATEEEAPEGGGDWRARVTYTMRSGDSTAIFKQAPEPLPQVRAYELLGLLPAAGN